MYRNRSYLVPEFKLHVRLLEQNLTWSKVFSFFKMVAHNTLLQIATNVNNQVMYRHKALICRFYKYKFHENTYLKFRIFPGAY